MTHVRVAAHAWFNEACLGAVRAKQLAWGTAQQRKASEKCSQEIHHQYLLYIQATRNKLQTLKRGSKQWWKMSKTLMHKTTTPSSVPALKGPDGVWARTAEDKANLLADTFTSKWVLPAQQQNAYSDLLTQDAAPDSFVPLRSRQAQKVLFALDEHSATGPDGIPAKLLRTLSKELAAPFGKLARCIVHCGAWPVIWICHWICALHKKKSMFDPLNYRGIQLTAQISKAMERFLAASFLPDLISVGAFGVNQFAYRPRHGARDAILFLIMSWLLSFTNHSRIGVYCSDVSGAFDKVSAVRLVQKLRCWKVHPRIISVLASWLRARRAHVVVGGAQSKEISMTDMVYQGTALGPSLWNTFFADSACPLHALNFQDIFYADDLNAFKVYGAATSDQQIFAELAGAQSELHTWGVANQVTFDASKESFHILSKQRPAGNAFTILGITFDCKLYMYQTIDDTVTACGWKLESILRTRRFFNDRELVVFFKSHILSFIAYRTPGIYHAAPSALRSLNNALRRFLRQLSISDVNALVHFGLAPLQARWDIAMLGVIHRTALGEGLQHFEQFFTRAVNEIARFVRH